MMTLQMMAAIKVMVAAMTMMTIVLLLCYCVESSSCF